MWQCWGVLEEWRRHQVQSREVRAESLPHPPTTNNHLIRVPKDTGSLGWVGLELLFMSHPSLPALLSSPKLRGLRGCYGDQHLPSFMIWMSCLVFLGSQETKMSPISSGTRTNPSGTLPCLPGQNAVASSASASSSSLSPLSKISK